MTQGFVGHHRPQIRSADADVDNIADGLAGVAAPGTGTHLVCKGAHAIQHRMHRRHHILTIHANIGIARRAQRHMQHSAILSRVDAVAAKHRVDLFAQPALLRQLQEQSQGLIGDAVFAVIEEEAGSLCSETLAALWVAGEKLPQMHALDLFAMRLERAPCRLPSKGWVGVGHVSSGF